MARGSMPFPARRIVEALKHCTAITVLERMDDPMSTTGNHLTREIKAALMNQAETGIMNKPARFGGALAPITRIGEQAWIPIKYPNAVWEPDDTTPGGGYWVSDAEVAEIDFVAFSSKKKAQQVPCRLVVRRVKRLQPTGSDGTVQGELFAAHRHHAFITNSTLSLNEASGSKRWG